MPSTFLVNLILDEEWTRKDKSHAIDLARMENFVRLLIREDTEYKRFQTFIKHLIHLTKPASLDQLHLPNFQGKSSLT
jgi:hypothetical protein